ncbi:hypothetical protein [Dactylosporangium sp. NPDC006015]|uniref:hypothetical protein n=1 Tax=Dactylosporangium sp. NPDC006015 TaxID=3154576 RepID=UPI0033B5E150
MSPHGWHLPPPDDDRPTVLAHAMALRAAHGPGPWPDGGDPLPDRQARPAAPLISDTVLEGIRSQHMTRAAAPTASPGLADLIEAVVRRPPEAGAVRRLRAAATAAGSDDLVRQLQGRDLPAGRLRELALHLARHGTGRDEVATGVMLLGVSGDRRDRDLLLLLGALDTLTRYAVAALRGSQPDPDRAVYELARRVDGWGRIHAVEQLRGTGDPEIRAWLLRDGYRNTIMDEYLAHLAATTGGLLDALAPDAIDEPLLSGADGILLALLHGGPAADITHYPDGPRVIDRYLTHAGNYPPDLSRVGVVGTLSDFIAGQTVRPSGSGPKADAVAWSAAERARLRDACDALTARPAWRELLDRALHSADPKEFQRAIWVAEKLHVPMDGLLRAHLRREPFDTYLWFSLVDGTSDIDGVLDLAAELLPLADLATGPTLDLGLGSDRPEHVLDIVVSRLDAHPGKGWPLIAAALANATVRNRNMAVRALDAWPAGTPAAAEAVAAAARVEPDPGIDRRMRALLRKWGM